MPQDKSGDRAEPTCDVLVGLTDARDALGVDDELLGRLMFECTGRCSYYVSGTPILYSYMWHAREARCVIEHGQALTRLVHGSTLVHFFDTPPMMSVVMYEP